MSSKQIESNAEAIIIILVDFFLSPANSWLGLDFFPSKGGKCIRLDFSFPGDKYWVS